MPRPLEFHTQKRQSVRLPLEGKLAQRQLRLMRSKPSTITMGWYKIATFNLIRHGLWPVTPSPPGEGFFLSRQPLRRFLPLKYRYQAGGACRRPYTQKRYCLPPLIRLCFAKPPSHRGMHFSKERPPPGEYSGGGIFTDIAVPFSGRTSGRWAG